MTTIAKVHRPRERGIEDYSSGFNESSFESDSPRGVKGHDGDREVCRGLSKARYGKGFPRSSSQFSHTLAKNYYSLRAEELFSKINY